MALDIQPMKLPRRKFLCLAASATALSVVSRVAGAQAYPTRPVRIVVPFPAGGLSDIVTRLVGQWLSERASPRAMYMLERNVDVPTEKRIEFRRR